MKLLHRATALIGALASLMTVSTASANGTFTYEVEIVNITAGQQFTPLLLATHRSSIQLFDLGKPASEQLATLAEEGNVVPLRTLLTGNSSVTDTEAGSALTAPGATVKFTIDARPFHDKLSIAAMLIPTNDAFVALRGVDLPLYGSATYFARAYDAGSEVNNERCAAIPGPNFAQCGGPGGGTKIGGGEGFVHVHRGMTGVGDFEPNDRTWQNPVAQIRVRRVR